MSYRAAGKIKLMEERIGKNCEVGDDKKCTDKKDARECCWLKFEKLEKTSMHLSKCAGPPFIVFKDPLSKKR